MLDVKCPSHTVYGAQPAYTNVKLSSSNQSHCQHLKVLVAVANANVHWLHAATSAESKPFAASKPVVVKAMFSGYRKNADAYRLPIIRGRQLFNLHRPLMYMHPITSIRLDIIVVTIKNFFPTQTINNKLTLNTSILFHLPVIHRLCV